jgi:hypothetical protein
MLTYADGAASSRILDEDVEEEVDAGGIGGVSAMSVVLDSRHSLTSAIVCLDLLANTAIANHQVCLRIYVWPHVRILACMCGRMSPHARLYVWPHVSACSSVCVAACLCMLVCMCCRMSLHAPLYVWPHVSAYSSVCMAACLRRLVCMCGRMSLHARLYVWPHVSAGSSVCMAACLRILLCMCGRMSPHTPLYVWPHVSAYSSVCVAAFVPRPLRQQRNSSVCMAACPRRLLCMWLLRCWLHMRLRILVCMCGCMSPHTPVCVWPHVSACSSVLPHTPLTDVWAVANSPDLPSYSLTCPHIQIYVCVYIYIYICI